jgi:PKD repeat protein
MARIGIWVQRIAIGTVVAMVGGLAIRVGSSASEALEFRDPTTWLASNATGEVVLANALTGEIQGRVVVGGAGDSLAVASTKSGVVAVNRSKGEAVFVDPTTEKIASRNTDIKVDPASVLLRSAAGPRLVSPASLVAFAGPTGTNVSTVDLPERLVGPVVTDDGAVYAIGSQTGSIRRVTDSLSDVRADGALGVSVGGNQIFAVSGGDRPGVARIQGTALKGAKACAAFALTAASVGTAQSDDARYLVAADGTSGRATITDLDADKCTAVTVARMVGATVGPSVVAGGVAYVPLYSTGEVAIVPLTDGATPLIVPALGTPGQPFDLFTRDGFVWFNDPVGAKAAVLASGGVVRSFDKYDKSTTGTGAAAGTGGTGSTGTGNGNGAGNGTGGASTSPTGTGSAGSGTAGTGSTSPANGTKTTGDGGGTGTRSAGKGAPDPNTPTPDANALVADFTYSSSVVPVNEKVTFTDTSTGSPTAWTWDFGDGSFAAGPKTDKSWTQAGFYTVALKAEANGASSIATTTIEVTPLEGKVRPKANFGFSAAQTEVGQPITFTDKSTGSPTELKWTFGDDTTATGSPIQHSWAKPGTYTVVLSATNVSGTATAQASITVFAKVEAPAAKIASSTTAVTVGQSVALQSASTGNPTSLQWTFGDGTTALGAVVSHSWKTPGAYTVTLNASNSAGSSADKVTITVREVVNIPEARLMLSTFDTVVGDSVRLTSLSINNPTTTSWSFGDNSSTTGVVVDHVWRSPGNYKVVLTVTNSAGTDTAETTVTVAARLLAPVAAFTSTPSTPRVGTEVQFTDTSTGGPTDTWSWDFGDGSAPSSQRNPVHPFTRAGSYDVTLTVGNNAGTNSRTVRITVAVPAPTAAFTFSPTTPRVNADVQFTDGSTDAATVSWNFGDGSALSSERNPVHRFAESKAYTVTLTVTNATDSRSTTRPVNVNPLPPVAAFTFAPAAPRVGDTVTFTNTSTGGAAAVLWTFPDGTTAATANASYRFAAAGNFQVTLVMTNASDSSSRTLPVTVVPQPPGADFTFAPAAPRINQAMTFTSSVTGTGPYTYAWTFDDGGTATTANATHTFTTAGTHTARLVVSNGLPTTVPTKSFTVLAPLPVASFTVSPATGTTDTVFTFTSTSTNAAAPTWNFGDSGPDDTATGVTVTHRFHTPGSKPVTLTVSGAGNVTDTHTVNVIVLSGPTVTANPTCAVTGVTVNCTSSNSYGGPFTAHEWTVTGAGAAPTSGTAATFSFAGTAGQAYVVTLKVSALLVTDSGTTNVTVRPA